MNRNSRSAYRTLSVIQLALTGGVLLFAVLVFTVVRPSRSVVDMSIMRWVWLAFALVSIFGAGVVRGRLRRDSTEQQAYTTAIIVWALAEGQALLGLVTYLVAGDELPAILGLVVGAYLLVRYRPSAFRPWFVSDSGPREVG